MSSQPEIICPHCLTKLAYPLPVEPLYSLDDARFMLQVPTRGAMWTLLWRHRGYLDKPRYAFSAGNRRQRMLTASEIRLLRDRRRMTTKGVLRWMLFDQGDV